LKRLDSEKEIQGLYLDFVAPDLDFAASGLGFVAKNLAFASGNLEVLHRAAASALCLATLRIIHSLHGRAALLPPQPVC
jgi:hypothetical protein